MKLCNSPLAECAGRVEAICKARDYFGQVLFRFSAGVEGGNMLRQERDRRVSAGVAAWLSHGFIENPSVSLDVGIAISRPLRYASRIPDVSKSLG